MGKAKTIAVWEIHDSVFSTKAKAEKFNDGKDKPKKYYINLQNGETLDEGEQGQHQLFDTLAHAKEELA